MAELKFFGYLTDLAGTRIREVSLAKPVLLRELVPASFPESDIIILINGKVGHLDSEVADQDAVILMPILSGG